MVDVKWDEANWEWMVHSLDGPVGKFLEAKSLEMAAIAKVAAPIQQRRNWSWGKRSSSYMPRSLGYLKGSVTPHMGWTRSGELFGGRHVSGKSARRRRIIRRIGRHHIVRIAAIRSCRID